MADPAEAWLRLLRTPGVGPVGYGRLLERFGGPAAVIAAPRAELEAAGLKNHDIECLRRPDEALLARDLAWVAEPGHHLLNLHDPAYPPLLGDIPDPPPLLFVNGDPGLLSQPQLAMVGSRNPTRGGSRNAYDFARFLSSCGLLVTSGMATGIDAAAHEGALSTGPTIAVFGTGPDRVYPAGNRELAHRIASRGTIVTELPPGTAPRRENFPRRNRIISGLSLGTLVVEAASRSGSLITARLAVEQGREAFAIPGSIHNPLAKGCHQLLRNGAKLVETAADIIEELDALLGSLGLPPGTPAAGEPVSSGNDLDQDYRTLLACMGHDPMSQDQLMQCSGYPSDVVSSMLLMLELEGYVESVPGGRYTVTRKASASIP